MFSPVLRAIRLTSATAALVACVIPNAFAESGQPRHPVEVARNEDQASTSDLDAFMEKVLARREVNRKVLNDYVLDEHESFEILGPGRAPLHRTRRDYTWYVRDGMHVRSPVRFNGVTVATDARDEYERTWIRRERERQERKAKKETTVTVTGVDVGPGGMPTEPRFVSEAYFMEFKFEPGNYLLAGREQFEGHDVLRIEYYPTRLFSDREEDSEKGRGRDTRETRKERNEEDDEIERKMNKTALVTLWVDPEEHQIVRYTFENVWLDFLPGAWLVRVDDVRASMTMGQPFPGVWLPRDINIHGGVTLASGSFEVALSRVFRQYREAQVKTLIRVPGASKVPDEPGDDNPDAESGPRDGSEGEDARGPRIAEASPEPAEIVRGVRVHGNVSLTDAEVLQLAGIALGMPASAEHLAAIEQRLRESRRFETVEVRKRYRSLTDPSDVVLVLVVHERPGVTSAVTPGHPLLDPIRTLRSRLLFLPIVSYADGYGLTYGARFSTIDLFNAGERFSVPLTWGATKRAALEFERTFERGPLSRVTAGVGISNRENPRFDVDDQRVEWRAGAERRFDWIHLGLDLTRSRVEFGDLNERLWTAETTAALDTRGNPAFPANAFYVGGGWTGLHAGGRPRINQYTADGRGYLRVVGQAVLAGRAQYFTSDGALPPYERLLLGGRPTLRGFRAGLFDGDRLVVTSAELRVPITSVLSGAKLGAIAFVDAAKASDYGSRLTDAPWRRGAGAGLFLIASVFKLNVDVARGLDDGGTRVHVGSGFVF